MKTLPILICAVLFCHRAQNAPTSVEPENVGTFIGDGYRIMDVRTPAEYNVGHISGALNIDVSSAEFAERAAKLDKNGKYIIHCSANVPNGRTDRAMETLRRIGFQNLVGLKGGFAAWQQQKREITTGN